jgi:PAS domain S-box-containing protein
MASESPDSINILHVDDEPDFADMAGTFLEREDDRLNVETAAAPSEAMDRLNGERFDCIVSDHDMPRTSGIGFLKQVRDEWPDLPFILFTGKGSEEVASEAMSKVATDYLQKDSGTEQYELLANRVCNAVEQYRSSQEAKQTRRRLQNLAESTSDCVWMFDRDWQELLFISGYEAVWKRPAEAIRDDPQDFLSGVHPENRAFVQDAMERMSNGESIDIEFRILRGDGESGWVWVQGEPVYDDDGRVESVVGFTQDITDRKQREQQLERYETIVRAFPDEVYTLDSDGCFTSIIPPAGEETTSSGHAPEELVGEHVSLVMDEEDIEKGEMLVQGLLESEHEQTKSFEMDVVTREGDRIAHEDHIALLPSNDGFQETVGVLRNIADRKEREQRLQRQNDRLEKFTSVVSHDLRNPLNVAQGRVELVQDECDSDHLDDVAQAHERMETLIEDLLSLAREGKQVSEVTTVDLGDMTEGCWRSVETHTATLSLETTQIINADSNRLKQLLENLFRNAVAHGGEEIVVTVGDLKDRDGFYVADDGPGIPDDERDKVFEAGYSTTDKGTGFGLNIVQEIAEAHEWEISVTDSEAGGARFEITGVETTAS